MTKNIAAVAGLAVLLTIASVRAQTGTGTVPTPGTPPVVSGDIIQFNNLTVQSVSGKTIVAYPDYPYVMMEGTGSSGSGAMRSTDGKAKAAPKTKCISYKDDASRGKEIPCPASPNSAPGSSTNDSRPTSVSPAPSQIIPEIYPVPPIYLYRIEVLSDTRLLFRDRTLAKLSDFTPGDQINVLGYYENDGSIRALIVRNLTKPEEKQFIQLENAELVSISGNTLVVIYGPSYPCYSFDASGSKSMMPCPLGMSTGSPALQGVAVPDTIMPRFYPSIKYAVAMDSQTILLDRNRNQMSRGDLAVGDFLNIYGMIGTASETIEADVIRDLSRPAKPIERKTFEGTITQIASDGTITFLADDGRVLTLQLAVDSRIRVNGILDEIKNFISGVRQVVINPPEEASTPFAIKTDSNLSGRVGQTFYAGLSISRADKRAYSYEWSVTAGALPPGLSLVMQTIYCIQAPCPQPTDMAALQGVPTQAGTYKFTITVRDNTGKSASETFTATIRE